MNELITAYTHTDIANTQQLTADLFNRYINYLDASPKTVETYTKALRVFFNYLKEQGIQRPTREDIISFKEILAGSGHKPTTIQNYIVAIRLFFKWTATEGLYPNITDHLKGVKLSREHKKDYLTSDQLKDVLTGVNKTDLKGLRDYAILCLMITGGLRTIEVVRANIEDIRTLGASKVLYIQGKGRAEKEDYIKLSAKVDEAIKIYLTEREAQEGKLKATDPLFASTSHNNSGERMTTRAISGLIKNHMIDAGYNSPRLTAHSLRHSAVTLSLQAGKDITEVQQFARHSNIQTTLIYNHALEMAKNSCSEAIADSLF